MPAFCVTLPVRFADCDPAGIVFYPRYFEMTNAVVEDWCAQGWGIGFDELIMRRGLGLPTVHLETDFVAPSRLGEHLDVTLRVERMGRASIHTSVTFAGPDGEERVRAKIVLALIDRTHGKAIALPPEIRERVALFLS